MKTLAVVFFAEHGMNQFLTKVDRKVKPNLKSIDSFTKIDRVVKYNLT